MKTFIIREKMITRKIPSKIMFFIANGIFVRNGNSGGFNSLNQVRISKKDAKNLIVWLKEAINTKTTEAKP